MPFFAIPVTIAATFGVFLVAMRNPIGRLRARRKTRPGPVAGEAPQPTAKEPEA